MPLAGWLRSSAGAYPLTWFALFDVPKFPLGRDDPAAALSAGAHAWLSWVLAALAAGHIGAALHHRWVLRDGMLARMLPWSR